MARSSLSHWGPPTAPSSMASDWRAEGFVGQGDAVFVDGAAAHEVFVEAEAELELVVDQVQHFFGFRDDFGADAVTGQ